MLRFFCRTCFTAFTSAMPQYGRRVAITVGLERKECGQLCSSSMFCGCIKSETAAHFRTFVTLTSASLEISWCPRFQGLLRTAQPDFGLHRCCVQILLQTIWTSGCTTRACPGCSWDEPHRRSGSLAANFAAFFAFLLSCCVNQLMFVPASVEH